MTLCRGVKKRIFSLEFDSEHYMTKNWYKLFTWFLENPWQLIFLVFKFMLYDEKMCGMMRDFIQVALIPIAFEELGKRH